MTTQYQSLNDARKVTGDDGFARGQTRIWYWKPEYARDYLMGYGWLKDQGIPVPDAKTLGRTHVKLGAIKESDPERVYVMMQGENWSPNVEARDLIAKRGLSHTSMSVGDILQMADGQLLMVDTDGFAKLASRSNPEGSFVERRSDLRQLVDAAEAELARAQSATDPLESVRAAVLASYYAGAAIYLARQKRMASMLDRAHTVFFRANMLAQAACGARGEAVQARYAPNPTKAQLRAALEKHARKRGRSAYDDLQKAMLDAHRDLQQAARERDPATQAWHAVQASSHAGAMWAFAKCELAEPATAHWHKLMQGAQQKADQLRDKAHEVGRLALQHRSPYRNPFVKTHLPVEPILTFGTPEVHKYRGWMIDLSPHPQDAPVEWMAQGKKSHRGGVFDQKTVFSDVGKHEAFKALRIEIDIEDEGDDAVIFWEWLENFIVELRKSGRGQTPSRSELARRIEVARKNLRSAPHTTQKELQPAFDWFYAQPIDYRVKFIDRALQFDALQHAPKARPSVPRAGRAMAPNALKRRLLR